MVRGKLHQFKSSISCSSTCYDIIMLTDTWLDSSFCDSELGLSDYFIYRCDRNCVLSGKVTGGGILVAVKKCFPCDLLFMEATQYEKLFLRVKIN